MFQKTTIGLGIAYVLFETRDQAQLSLGLSGQKLRHRVCRASSLWRASDEIMLLLLLGASHLENIEEDARRVSCQESCAGLHGIRVHAIITGFAKFLCGVL